MANCQVVWCPTSPDHKTFSTGATICQVWKVDECGEWIETQEECSDVFAYPDANGNIWDCCTCQTEGVHERPTYPEDAEDDGGYKTFQVEVDLSEVIDHNLEGFLDLLGERVGNPLLMDVSYEVICTTGDTLTIKVTGDDSNREEGE